MVVNNHIILLGELWVRVLMPLDSTSIVNAKILVFNVDNKIFSWVSQSENLTDLT